MFFVRINKSRRTDRETIRGIIRLHKRASPSRTILVEEVEGEGSADRARMRLYELVAGDRRAVLFPSSSSSLTISFSSCLSSRDRDNELEIVPDQSIGKN